MEKTGLEILKMIEDGKAPKKITKLDTNVNNIFIWNSEKGRYGLTHKNSIFHLELKQCLNEKFEIEV